MVITMEHILFVSLMISITLVLGLLFFLKKRCSTAKVGTKSITKWLFVTTQVSALIWVFLSYGIAIYSMVNLGEVYTLSEVFDPAITTILGAVALKTVGNIFEHNNGGIFGESDYKEDSND